ncbi:hypothetical protein OAS69_06885 [Pseudomonadales bacterium]|nr:hypothetical protein [Pseudomonadales bacterium]MDC1102486.1 hypothetical protein [Pseudomonadales bacterium]
MIVAIMRFGTHQIGKGGQTWLSSNIEQRARCIELGKADADHALA